MRGTARAHFLDREKRIEVGLWLFRRAVELTEERVRTASATLICQNDIAPGPSSVARHNRVAEKLGRRLTGTPGEIHDGIVATRLAIDSRRRQHDDAEGDGAAATRGLILVDGEAVAAGLGHGNARTGLICTPADSAHQPVRRHSRRATLRKPSRCRPPRARRRRASHRPAFAKERLRSGRPLSAPSALSLPTSALTFSVGGTRCTCARTPRGAAR